MANNKKIEEALAHIREAEKSLKTGLLKWTPDYDCAADEYNRAATCFKTAKQYVQCRECLMKAAENYKLIRSYFSAAKCYEQAAHVSKDLGEIDKVASYSETAAGLFRDHGVVDTAAMTLDKGAKMVEEEDPNKAIRLYRYAVDIVMTEDRPRQAAEYQCKVSRHLIRLQRFDDAVLSIRRELSFYQEGESMGPLGRLAVGLVLVQLKRGDTVAAEKAFREWGGYSEEEEVRTMESLLQAFDEEDGELAKRALNSPFIKHMDVEYAKLARDLPVPKTAQGAKKSSGGASSYVADSLSSPAAEDDEELNLC